jgi:hypothetical protein
MSALLGFVPIVASATLGLIYLRMGAGGPTLKAAGTALFLAAAWLQFFSPWSLAGVLLQCLLALTLEFWRRMNST